MRKVRKWRHGILRIHFEEMLITANFSQGMKFEILTKVKMSILELWVTLCGLEGRYQHFRRISCLRIQGWKYFNFIGVPLEVSRSKSSSWCLLLAYVGLLILQSALLCVTRSLPRNRRDHHTLKNCDHFCC